MKRFGITTIIAISALAFCTTAFAQRRPGTIGKYSDRHLTQARNSLGVVMGPQYQSLFGSRFGDGPAFDAGYQLLNPELRTTGNGGAQSSDLIHQLNAGVMFGITEHWEAGAIFLPFTLSPDLSYDDIRVAITYSQMTRKVDFGFRLHMNAASGRFGLSPGVPLVARLGNSRIDTGIYLPLFFPDSGTMVGLNVPVRAAYNFIPHLYAGLESGVYIPDFKEFSATGARIPVGVFTGVTILGGKSIYDITASFMWDDFALLGVDEYENLQYNSFRFSVGLSWRKMTI